MIKVLLLRAVEQSEELAQKLSISGFEPIFCPLIEIHPIPNPLSKIFLIPFTTLIFTSANGVKFFFKAIDPSYVLGKKIAAVGPKTREALLMHKINTDFMPEKFAAAEMGFAFKNENILILTPLHVPNTLHELLSKENQVTSLPIYENINPNSSSIPIENNIPVIFTSSSCVDRFFTHPSYQGEKIVPVCIGPNTAKTLAKYFAYPPYIAEEATSDSIINCLKKVYHEC